MNRAHSGEPLLRQHRLPEERQDQREGKDDELGAAPHEYQGEDHAQAEHGFTGLGLYLALIASTLISLRRIARQARRNPALAFHSTAAQMIEVSLVGYLITGAFLSMSYFDLFYHLVAITVILKVLVLRGAALAVAAVPPTAGPHPSLQPARVTVPPRRVRL